MTASVLEAVRAVSPHRLYIAADGPRADRRYDEEHCMRARQVATHVDWPCDVRTLFRSDNLGCRVAVSRAVTWFFTHEADGIILEDDCVPDPTFFAYCGDLLTRYRDDARVMAISGNGLHASSLDRPHSYLFSRYNHVWGWASWRRAWASYDDQMLEWPKLRSAEWLEEIGDGHRDFARYWTAAFDAAYAGTVDSWAYRWTYSCWKQQGLTALPSRNVVKNIGFGSEATHTRDHRSRLARAPLEALDLPLVHPPGVQRDAAADRWIDLHVFGTHQPLYRRVLGRPARAMRRRVDRLMASQRLHGGPS